MRKGEKLENSSGCFGCGVENSAGLRLAFYRLQKGVVRVDLSFDRRFQDYPGVVHGGIIQLALLETAGRTCMTEADVRLRFVTCKRSSVEFVRPVLVDTPMHIEACEKDTDNEGRHAQATLFDERGRRSATLVGVFVSLPRRLEERMDPVAAGWKVYPDSVVA